MSYSLPQRKEIPVHRDELVELEQRVKDEITKVQQQLKQSENRRVDSNTSLWDELYQLRAEVGSMSNRLAMWIQMFNSMIKEVEEKIPEPSTGKETRSKYTVTGEVLEEELPKFIPRTSAQHQQEDVNKVYSSLQAADIAKQEPKGVVLTEEEHTEAYFIQLANNAALR
jgi:hypothetical protein